MKDNSLKRTTILTSIVCLLPILLGIFLYSKFPDTMPIHWDAAGNPNGWASKSVAVFVLPGILLLINLLFPILLKVDPKYKNIDNKVKTLLHWIIPVVSVFANGTTFSFALGNSIDFTRIVPMFLGLIFIIIGNYMPKLSQSYTVGIKLPWTLNNEENWHKTHRMAGFLWVIGGIVILITGALGLGIVFTTAMIIVMAVLPMIYSFILYTKGY